MGAIAVAPANCWSKGNVTACSHHGPSPRAREQRLQTDQRQSTLTSERVGDRRKQVTGRPRSQRPVGIRGRSAEIQRLFRRRIAQIAPLLYTVVALALARSTHASSRPARWILQVFPGCLQGRFQDPGWTSASRTSNMAPVARNTCPVTAHRGRLRSASALNGQKGERAWTQSPRVTKPVGDPIQLTSHARECVPSGCPPLVHWP